MNIDKLVRMANQIGTFFETMPDRQQACADIAMHLRRFWEPRMRSEILSHLEQVENHGLKKIVAEAIIANKEMLR